MDETSEITRDEIKFGKFLDRLRSRFNALFYDLMKKQCLLKGIAAEDWDQIRDDILFVYETDTHFDELKNAELMEQRLNLVGRKKLTIVVDTSLTKRYVITS